MKAGLRWEKGVMHMFDPEPPDLMHFLSVQLIADYSQPGFSERRLNPVCCSNKDNDLFGSPVRSTSGLVKVAAGSNRYIYSDLTL